MEAAAGGSEAVSWWRRRGDILAVLALFVAAFVFTSEQVAEHEMMSPIDEYQYVGYYAQVADKGIVRRGEPMPLYARRYMVCNGVRNIPEMPPNPQACRKPNSVGYPLAGGTTADLYTPLYFATTRVIAQPLIWAGVDFVDAGRAVGGVWLGLGAAFLYLAMRRARAPVPVALGLNLVLIGSVPAYWGTTYISTDATALLSGGLAAWLTMRALDKVRGSLVVLPLVAVVATLFKLQNFIAFVVAASVLVLAAALAARRTEGGSAVRLRSFITDRRMFSAAAILIGSITAQAGWLAVRSGLSSGQQPSFGFGAPMQRQHLVIELGNFLPSLGGGALSPFATGPASLPVYAVATGLAIGGAVGLAMSKGVSTRQRIVGVSTVLVAVVAAPALALVVSVVENNYVPLPSRYGNSLLPWALLSAALLMDRPPKWMRYGVLVLGVLTWGVALAMGEA